MTASMTHDHATAATWHAFAVTRDRPSGWVPAEWTLSATATGWQIEMAGSEIRDWGAFARGILLADGGDDCGWLLTHDDAALGIYRASAFTPDDVFIGALLAGPVQLSTGRDWLAARLGTSLDPGEKFRLMDGRPSGLMVPRGELVCFCCQIGRTEIRQAIVAGCTTIAAISTATRAGSHCGGCHSRLVGILDQAGFGPAT